ncbi:MAG: hypothetical protein EPN20_03195 [Magnetospirillum sp.]|nr:MAG: hypothetical protein EPN20_03195 [Magnetospirillum sp.]
MQALSSVSQNLLLNRKDEAASHSTRPEKTGTASAFASYAFGPMDMPDKDRPAKIDANHGKAVTGASSVTSTVSSSAAFLTQLAAS